jgi:ribonuclease HII
MKNFDNSFLNDDIKLIAGVDEAGRGPLAGPVVAAAVIFSPHITINGVNDSKILSQRLREKLYDEIIENCITYSYSIVSPKKIDKINILNASLLSMKRSVNKLKVQPDLILIDGNKSFKYNIPTITVVKGDSKSFSIAAASIIAKVTRDKLMRKYAVEYPNYNWEKNKGYPTLQHRESIKEFGASPMHRKTFLKNVLAEIEIN